MRSRNSKWTATYSAEFGKNMTQVNVVTKSGANLDVLKTRQQENRAL